jgi:pimeloyl-ACP methyl ester carboxylesterase
MQSGDRRFHLVAHDWGGSIAWGLADRHPDRVASPTVLSLGVFHQVAWKWCTGPCPDPTSILFAAASAAVT